MNQYMNPSNNNNPNLNLNSEILTFLGRITPVEITTINTPTPDEFLRFLSFSPIRMTANLSCEICDKKHSTIYDCTTCKKHICSTCKNKWTNSCKKQSQNYSCPWCRSNTSPVKK